MILVLLCVFIAAHFLAFWLLRDNVPFAAFRWYCLAYGVRSIPSLLPWPNTDLWWHTLWLWTEPIMLFWQAMVTVEACEWTNIRVYPEESGQLRKAMLAAAALAFLLRYQVFLGSGDMFDRFVDFQVTLRAAFAIAASVAAFHFWRRPLPGMCHMLVRHGVLLVAYYWANALADLPYPHIHDTEPAYWVIRGLWLGAVTVLMVLWGLLLPSGAAADRAARYQIAA